MTGEIIINHAVVLDNADFFDAKSALLEEARKELIAARDTLSLSWEGRAKDNCFALIDELIGNLDDVAKNAGTFSSNLYQADSAMDATDRAQSNGFKGGDK